MTTEASRAGVSREDATTHDPAGRTAGPMELVAARWTAAECGWRDVLAGARDVDAQLAELRAQRNQLVAALKHQVAREHMHYSDICDACALAAEALARARQEGTQ